LLVSRAAAAERRYVGQARARWNLFRESLSKRDVKLVASSLTTLISLSPCTHHRQATVPICSGMPSPAAVADPPTEEQPPPYLPNGCIPGEHDVRSWKRVDPASLPPEQDFGLDYSPCHWSVAMRDGVPTATTYRAPPLSLPPSFHLPDGRDPPPRVAQLGRAGVLLGYNHGEWGGSLLWCSTAGLVQRELLDDNIVAILPVDGRFVVLAGVSHLGLDRGRVLELADGLGGFKPLRTTELGSAPTAGAVEPSGGILITTTRGLVRLTPEFHVHRLLDFHWDVPVNIGLDGSNTAYIGMRGIVAEIKLDSDPPSETWLFPI
jgi:hypothetical protein